VKSELIEKRKFLLLLARQAPELEAYLRRHSRESAKWRIETTGSVATVLNQFENFPPDLVVIDPANMEGGLEHLLEHAKRNWPRTFFSLLTAQPESDFQAAVERFGNLPIIPPGKPSQVSKAIEQELVGLVNGTLEGLSLSSFLQMMEWESKSVAIHVSAAESWGRMHLLNGKFVSAYVHGQELADEVAAIEILTWDNVKINVERSYHNQKHTSLIALSSLILDAMRRKDEANKEPGGERFPETDHPDDDLPISPVALTLSEQELADAELADLELADLKPADFGPVDFEPAEFELDHPTLTGLSAPEPGAHPLLSQTLFDEDAFMPVWPEDLPRPKTARHEDDDETGLYIIQSSVSVPSRQMEHKLLTRPNSRDLLITDIMAIDGALAAALVDHSTGLTLERVGSGATIDLDLAGAAMTEVVKSQRRAMTLLNISGAIEDLLVTLHGQYHMLYLLPKTTLFLYVVLRREDANLALAHYRLKLAAGRLQL
jgi:predicted regulator of Ras-like GTPase activity (Roadblock/LC7/MglB family)